MRGTCDLRHASHGLIYPEMFEVFQYSESTQARSQMISPTSSTSIFTSPPRSETKAEDNSDDDAPGWSWIELSVNVV